MALSGDTALIGAHQDGAKKGAHTGAAYVFVRSGTTWVQQQRFQSPDGATGLWFGKSVALVGDTALVGKPLDDEHGSGAGSAYVFVQSGNTWTQQQRLLASDGAANDNFGWSVSFSADRALVGAYKDDDLGRDSGAAYLFVRSGTTWTQRQKLLSPHEGPHGMRYEKFGYSVALSGETVLVGGPNAGKGAVYVD